MFCQALHLGASGGIGRRASPCRAAACCLIALTLVIAGGCRSFSPLQSAKRLDQGYTVVLPGVLGHAPWDDNLAAGLSDAGVPGAIEVYDWTQGPLLLGYNLFARNDCREHGKRIARKIVDYQAKYPGRPVHLIGHSGGASAVIKTLEALPPDHPVTSAVLLAPGLPADYDLRLAMSRTEDGLHNFYSPYDLLISAMYVPTLVNHSKQYEPIAAGAFGFQVPEAVQGRERAWYEHTLKQHPYELEMLESGHIGDHFGWTNPWFVSRWVAPVIKTPHIDVRRLPETGEATPAQQIGASAPRRPGVSPPSPPFIAAQ